MSETERDLRETLRVLTEVVPNLSPGVLVGLALRSTRAALELVAERDRLRGALADIAFSDAMPLEVARRKAERVYNETAREGGRT